MGIEIKWKESYSVGNKTLDNQHRHLFELTEKLIREFNEREIKRGVMELYKYTRTHFSLEEELMDKAGFPDIGKHRVSHDILIDKLNEVAMWDFSTLESVHKFQRFVLNWLFEHIMQQDKKYFDYLKDAD